MYCPVCASPLLWSTSYAGLRMWKRRERHPNKFSLEPYRRSIVRVLLSMSIHLETESMDRGASPENPWVFPLETNNPIVAKKRAYEILKEEWNNGEFQRLNSGPIGTHSLRKYPSTYSQQCGCSRDNIDFRGRWKRTKKQIDTYIDVELPYPDAKIACSFSLHWRTM